MLAKVPNAAQLATDQRAHPYLVLTPRPANARGAIVAVFIYSRALDARAFESKQVRSLRNSNAEWKKLVGKNAAVVKLPARIANVIVIPAPGANVSQLRRIRAAEHRLRALL
jgi:hypothetical protein